MQHISKLGYEIVVVDTGSKDNSKNIAKEFTDKVHDFKWCDDFSATRNFSIEKASNEFVMIVDSDEYITGFDKKYVENFLEKNPQKVGRVHIKNEIIDKDGGKSISDFSVSRLFSKKYYKYTGRIHEQVTRIDGKNYYAEILPISADHVGYAQNEDVKKIKSQRNIKLLEKELEENGDTPYILYQLGRAYYYCYDYSKCIHYLKKAIDFDLDADLEYVSDLVETYGYALINKGYYNKALNLEVFYPYFSDNCDYVFLMGLIYMNKAMFDKAIK